MPRAPQRVSFKNGSIDVAGDIRYPDGFDANEKYAALVITTPGSNVKEQIGAFYGGRRSDRGFITLAFDPSYQGESGGEPRDLEDPAARVEDVRCAVDFLTTLPYVAEDRIGILGVCAGGGYAVNAAMTEHRIKAVGTGVVDKNSTNRRLFRGDALLLGFDAFHLVGELLTQPIQVIVGGRLGTTFSFGDGQLLWERARNKKDFFVIDGAGHYDMYDVARYVDRAVEKLDGFYKEHLGQQGSRA